MLCRFLKLDIHKLGRLKVIKYRYGSVEKGKGEYMFQPNVDERSLKGQEQIGWTGKRCKVMFPAVQIELRIAWLPWYL